MVSIIIPTYNRGFTIGKSIDSVLSQTYRPIDLIIVDDGSTDDTREVVGRYGSKVRYIYKDNGGLASARNAGLLIARGEFVAFQDSDDIWLPWKLKAQVSIMRKCPELALVWTDMVAIDSNDRVVRDKHLRKMYSVYQKININEHLPQTGMLKDCLPDCPKELQSVFYRYGDIFSAMFLGNLVHPPTALLRRIHVSQNGGLDITFSWTCEDYEFFWRISKSGLGALIEASSMLYRVGAVDQLTKPDLLLYVARGNLALLEHRLLQDRAKIKLESSTILSHMADAQFWVANEELESNEGKKKKAVVHFLSGLRLNPFPQMAFFRFLFLLIFPKRLVAAVRSAKRRLIRNV